MRTPKQPGRRERPWHVKDTRRQTAAERGYDATWQRYSEQYRRIHPLCVPCLLGDRVRGSRCVDHIVPKHSCPSLFWEPDNHCAMCFACHGSKTRKEPTESWEPRDDRIVCCGVDLAAVREWATASGLPSLIAIDGDVNDIDDVGPCVVIVQSITRASLIAARLRGVVKHMTEQHVERPSRAGR